MIERVSILFHGHPDLISGFNTFLPPGYRIDFSTDPNEPDIIKVTTPTGLTLKSSTRPPMSTSGGSGSAGHHPPTSMASGPRGILLREQDNAMIPHNMGGIPPGAPPPHPSHPSHPPPPPHAAAAPGYQTPYGHMPPPHPPSLPHPSTSAPLAPPHPPPPPHSMPPHMPPPPPPPMHAAAPPPPPHGSYIPGPNAPSRRPPSLPAHDVQDQAVNGNGNTRRAPVEFNHAIDYVNKIKVSDTHTHTHIQPCTCTYECHRIDLPMIQRHTSNSWRYYRHIKRRENLFKR